VITFNYSLLLYNFLKILHLSTEFLITVLLPKKQNSWKFYNQL
jgi:hypothetical protein